MPTNEAGYTFAVAPHRYQPDCLQVEEESIYSRSAESTDQSDAPLQAALCNRSMRRSIPKKTPNNLILLRVNWHLFWEFFS